MIFRVPSYYKDFKCIAGACRHSCCIGWEVDIDEDTSSYYKSVEGAFGERLRAHMQTEDMDYFALEENGWCPFLNEQKLCDICIALGEESLSEVCTEYPRFTMEYENVREKILSLSCEEVGRIVFSSDEKMTWEEREIPGDIEMWDETEEKDAESEDTESEVAAEKLESVRAHAVELLQDRTMPVFKRAAEYLRYCEDMQKMLYGGAENNAAESQDFTAAAAYLDFRKRMESFDRLEVLDDTWNQVKEGLCGIFTEENYLKAQQGFAASEGMREVEYEHLLVYFTFRYFMRAYYDDNLLSKAQFAVLSVLMIRDMDVACYLANNGNFTLQDRIDTARIYSREVEHSEENMEMLAEDFCFEESFYPHRLIEQLLQ